MTADEVIMRLKDRMSQHSQQFRQAFLSFDRRGKGLVSKKDFRQVGWLIMSPPTEGGGDILFLVRIPSASVSA